MAFCSTVKALELEDIYADPHKIDPYLASGESVAVLCEGREVAKLVPRTAPMESSATAQRPQADYRARFLKMWGPDAFASQTSVVDEFAELRRGREL
jgi:antitoxin (DNA-binding transcriptional repressor) of toxin-antitoxin stability system